MFLLLIYLYSPMTMKNELKGRKIFGEKKYKRKTRKIRKKMIKRE